MIGARLQDERGAERFQPAMTPSTNMTKKPLPRLRDLCPMCGRRLAFAHYYAEAIRITQGSNKGIWHWEFTHEPETQWRDCGEVEVWSCCYGTEQDALRSDVRQD